ncbi:hypothetical protein BCL32_2097 [Rhizobium mongolense USDA 1844]|uniref:Uncharacterized protein n=1 Tax=Rhizobium mongolense USDA 1844 TaxID=1079460 RepID=A0A559TGV2_9HYPH|nr:hypothetical protein BCL32_2097 [Rhizobium mongolense USDA 1844]
MLTLARTAVSFMVKWTVIFVLAVITVFWTMKVLHWAGFSYLPTIFMFLCRSGFQQCWLQWRSSIYFTI